MTSPRRELGDSVHFGVKWLGIAMGSAQLMRLVATVVLARLLAREHFGLLTLAQTGLVAVSAFREMGFGQALVRRKMASEDEERLAADTAFWILQVLNGTLFVLAWVFTPAIAAYFDKVAGLEPVLRALLFVFLIEGLSTVAAALLQKRLAFESLARNEIRATFVYAVVAVTLAVAGFGVWSLVTGQIVSRTLQISGLLRLSGWRPRLRFDRAIALDLFRFGRWLWGNGLLQAATRTLDKLVIGKLYTDVVLGVYGVASNLCRAPARPATNILVRVAFPALASIQDDRAAIARSYGRGVSLVSFVVLPATVGLVTVAPDFITTVYGSRWNDMAPIVQVLAFSGLALVLGGLSGPVLLALGKPNQILWVGLARHAMFFALLAALADRGVLGVAVAVALPMVIAMLVGHVCAARACGADPRFVLGSLARSAAATALMAGAVLSVAWTLPADLAPPLRLCATVTVGVAAYALATALWNRAVFEDALHNLRRVLGAKGESPA